MNADLFSLHQQPSAPSTLPAIGEEVIRLIAYGYPAPQGSKKFVGHSKAGHAIMIESSNKVAPWREDVGRAARAALTQTGGVILDGSLAVRMVFTLPKPASAPKRRRSYPNKKPDLSKLARSTEDALTTAGLIADDARIVEFTRLAKVFPREDPEALDAPGVRIEIRVLR
jgi:Holliday junction resolvase RusA-like endonuclease